MSAVHYIIIVCGALAAAAPSLEAAFPTAANIVKVAATILALVVTVLGPLSPQARLGGGEPPRSPDDTKPNTPAAMRGFARTPMVFILAMLGAVGFSPLAKTSLQGCSWWSSGGGSQVETAAGQVGSCVLTAALAGGTDPAAIIAQCSGATVGDVAAIVESIIAYYTTSPPAPPNAAPVPPPVAPPGLIDGLRTLDAKCHVLLKGGAS